MSLPNPSSDLVWIPFAFTPDYKAAEWVQMSIAELRSAPFLDGRSLTPQTPRRTISLAESLKTVPAQVTPPPMIFHAAFCCSTLMAKALDLPEVCLSLKEPNILMSLANAKRMLKDGNPSGPRYQDVFRFVMYALSQLSGERVLLKPTNAANNLLPDVIAAGGSVAFMFASLEDFLISVLKKGEACKSFMRTQYNIFSLDPSKLAQIDPRQAMTFTDLQVATLVWRYQLELFQRHKGQGYALRDKDFLSTKKDAMQHMINALNLPHSAADIDAAVSSDVFAKDVKFADLPQNQSARENAAKDIRERYAQELNDTLAWADNLRLDGDIIPF